MQKKNAVDLVRRSFVMYALAAMAFPIHAATTMTKVRHRRRWLRWLSDLVNTVVGGMIARFGFEVTFKKLAPVDQAERVVPFESTDSMRVWFLSINPRGNNGGRFTEYFETNSFPDTRALVALVPVPLDRTVREDHWIQTVRDVSRGRRFSLHRRGLRDPLQQGILPFASDVSEIQEDAWVDLPGDTRDMYFSLDHAEVNLMLNMMGNDSLRLLLIAHTGYLRTHGMTAAEHRQAILRTTDDIQEAITARLRNIEDSLLRG